MSDQVIESVSPDGATVAVYHTHQAAEEAVRRLQNSGIPVNRISIIGRDWQVREDVQGFYHAGDAVAEGATSGAWFGGLFGLLLGFGLFVIPVAGTLLVLGPLGGLIAGAIGGAGIGAIVGGLMSLGIPKDEAIKYQSRLEAGQFLVVVHGSVDEINRAHAVLEGTADVTEVKVHPPLPNVVV
jgi:uncharacterized membrane protein